MSNRSISPFFPKNFANMPKIQGVKMSTARAPIKNWKKDDVLVVELDKSTNVAGVFTTSKTAGYNIDYCKSIISYGKARVLVVSSGNANVAVGKKGCEIVKEVIDLCKNRFQCSEKEVFFSATGVIGKILPIDNLKKAILEASNTLNDNKWKEAANAIMTTDTYPKMITRKLIIADTEVTINGICKGSGMIAPNMATTLSYIFTDASISSNVLQTALNEYVKYSFNSITVDGDTSTSDMILIFATNKANHDKITDFQDKRLEDFKKVLKEMLVEMAHLVVKDGEGAKKFVTVNVKNALTFDSAQTLAFSIANSPLVKTAIAGGDANWGRIIMALGKAGESIDKNKISITVGSELIVKDGELNSSYNEKTVINHMKQESIYVSADLNLGCQEATVWTCDLTYDFIKINAEYLT